MPQRSVPRDRAARLTITISALAAAALVACGGGSSPTPGPTPTPTPTPTPQPVEWSVSGRVVEYATGRAVPGAQLTVTPQATVTIDPAGAFKISSTGSPVLLHVQIDASGYIARETWVQGATGARTGVTIDIIRDAVPFSLAFYRELVRDAFEWPALQPLARLTERPNIYLRTVDQNGKAIEPEVLDSVTQSIRKAVSDWSARTLSVAAFERGAATRPRTNGWIVVNILRDRNSDFCGQSYVGVPDGQIDLWDDRCACGSKKIGGSLVAHEVGHAMGFWHVSDKKAIMAPVGDNCPTGVLTENEKYHSKLAYGRPPGNLDRDIDPDTMTPLAQRPGVLVVN